MATHSRRRCLGAATCGVGAAMPLFIFSSPLQRMSSAPEALDLANACTSPRTAPDVVGFLGGTYSRVAERTHLFSEGKYSGKCKVIMPI